MKRYVIKDSKGRYQTLPTYEFDEDIQNATLYWYYENAKSWCPEDCEIIELQLAETVNQDKISFAVEQLENCRLSLIKLLNKKLVYLDSSTADEMDDLFDNQIKQLKEMK